MPRLGRAGVGLGLALAGLAGPPAQAQIATDGTLGAATALVGPNFAIPASLGRQAGANLFHSFSTFGVPTGGSATFSGPGTVANIISRVTGGGASSIDGTLRSTMAGANLFLVNPSGILFGPNASLDLTGSFHASTANYLKFADGVRFEAAAVPASLSVAAPEAFGFLGSGTAPIEVQGSRLEVASGRSLSLVGGRVALNNATLIANAGDLRLVGMTQGEAPLDAGSRPVGAAFAPVSVADSQLLTLSGTGTGAAPGRVVIRAGTLQITGSSISSDNQSPEPAGEVTLDASGAIRLAASSVATYASGAGRGANVRVAGADVSLETGSSIETQAPADGAGGDIVLQAAGRVTVRTVASDAFYSYLYAAADGNGKGGDIRVSGDAVTMDGAIVQTQTTAAGGGGTIRIEGRTVEATNGPSIYSLASPGSTGAAGDVSLAASESVLVAGVDPWGYPAFVGTLAQGGGRGGSVALRAPAVNIADGAQVWSAAYGTGRGGDVLLEGETVRMIGVDDRGTLVGTAVEPWATGSAGDLTVRASREFEFRGAQAAPSSYLYSGLGYGSTGDGGRITIESPRITMAGPAFVFTYSLGSGLGGAVRIRTHDIDLKADSAILSTTDGPGDGGSVAIEGTGRLSLATVPVAPAVSGRGFNRSDVSAWSSGSGKAGDVTIDMPELVAGLVSYISSGTGGPGDGGTITINADRVKLTGSSAIDVSSVGAGNGGRIVMNVRDALELVERDAGQPALALGYIPVIFRGGILSRGFSTGDPGSISITAPRMVLDDARIILSTALSGQGGRVDIRTGELTLRNGAQIDAKSLAGSTGDAGSIDVVVNDRLEIRGMSSVDGAFSGINAESLGAGRAGGIRVSARGITIDRGFIRSSTAGAGDAGAIDIRTGDVVLSGGGFIDAGTGPGSTGRGGNVAVAATGSIVVSGVDHSPIVALTGEKREETAEHVGLTPGREQGALASAISTNTAGEGEGGSVTVRAPLIRVEDGGRIAASTSASGDAGAIRLVAGDTVVDGGFVGSSTSGRGNAGSVDLVGRTITLRNGARVEASGAKGAIGRGGNVSLAASDDISATGDRTAVTTSTEGPGSGGAITLEAPRIRVASGAVVSATSTGEGAAGRIDVRAADALYLHGGAITTDAQASDGGNIDIRAGRIIHLRNGEISTSVAGGAGAGGNIFIDPTFVIMEGGSRIFANAFGGPGGNITIIADYFFSAVDSLVQASSALGVPGTVSIVAPLTDPNASLAKLPTATVDPSALLREGCATRYAGASGSSSLVDAGRGGLAASPERLAASRYFGPATAPRAEGAREHAVPGIAAAGRARLGGCNG